MSAKFINLVVTNGGVDGGMTFNLNPGMEGDNLINTDIINLVSYTLTAAGPTPSAKFEISTNVVIAINDGMTTTEQMKKYVIYASKSNTGTYQDAASLPSADWMAKAKKAITEAISNEAPGGGKTTVVFPKDGTEQVYLRSITY